MRQPMIADRDKAQLKRIFRKDLTKEVTIRLFTQKPSPVTVPGRECRYCPETQQIMEELSALSPKVHLDVVDFYQEPQRAREAGATRIPAIILGAKGDSRAKFYGIPTGYGLGDDSGGHQAHVQGREPPEHEYQEEAAAGEPAGAHPGVHDSYRPRLSQNVPTGPRIRLGMSIRHVGRSGSAGVPGPWPGLRGEVGAGDGNQRTHQVCRSSHRVPVAGENAPSRDRRDADSKGRSRLAGPRLNQEKVACLKS